MSLLCSCFSIDKWLINHVLIFLWIKFAILCVILVVVGYVNIFYIFTFSHIFYILHILNFFPITRINSSTFFSYNSILRWNIVLFLKILHGDVQFWAAFYNFFKNHFLVLLILCHIHFVRKASWGGFDVYFAFATH